MSNVVNINNQHLHPLIYFVADCPAKDNLSAKVPLVGTKSYVNLLIWCGLMDVDVSRVRFFNQADDPFKDFSGLSLRNAVATGHIKVVTLGNKAMEYLLDVGVEDFFALPHPSPKNRVLNDKRKLKNTLGQCRNYIYET